MSTKIVKDSVRTPKVILDWVQTNYGKTNDVFDPCPFNPKFDSTCVDGLKIPWGKVTFCNPPYSQMRKWVPKAYAEWKLNKTIIIMVKVRSLATNYFKNSQGCKVLFFNKRFIWPGYTELPHFHSALLIYEAGVKSNEYGFFP